MMQLYPFKTVIMKNIKTIAMKKKSSAIRITFAFCLAALLLNSCEPFFNCIDGNGISTTETRVVTEFYAIDNSTSIDIEVIADSVFSVEVTADENILNFVETYVRHGVLYIDTDYNRCFNSRGYMLVEVRMPELESIEQSGSGDMELYDFDCNYLEVNSSGSGDIDILNLYCDNILDIINTGSGDISVQGKARRGDYLLNGSGDIIADDLRVDECYITSTGSGRVYCYVYDLLNVTISGSGDVYYSGPIDDKDIHEVNSGSGKLRKP